MCYGLCHGWWRLPDPLLPLISASLPLTPAFGFQSPLQMGVHLPCQCVQVGLRCLSNTRRRLLLTHLILAEATFHPCSLHSCIPWCAAIPCTSTCVCPAYFLHTTLHAGRSMSS